MPLISRTVMAAVLTGLLVPSLVLAQASCRPADTKSDLLIRWLGTYTSATSGGNLASRDILKLPSVPANQLAVVTQEATCRNAKATYEATVTPQGGTGLSGSLYVVKAGTVFAVVDPGYHYGPDPGWWTIVTMDDKYQRLSRTTVRGIP